jgi:hypothetical protein
MPNVGKLIVDLEANTATFTGPLGNAERLARGNAKGIQDSFNNIDLGESRGAFKLLMEDLGIHMPRHLSTFISSISGLDKLLAAAFIPIAVVTLGKVIFETYEKMQKLKEEAKKAHEEMMAGADSTNKAVQNLDLSTLQLQDHTRELLGKPAQNRFVEEIIKTITQVNTLSRALDDSLRKQAKLMLDTSVGRFHGAISGQAASEADSQRLQGAVNDFLTVDAEYNRAVNESYAKHRDAILHGTEEQKRAAAEAIASETKAQKAARDKQFADLSNEADNQLQKLEKDQADRANALFKKNAGLVGSWKFPTLEEARRIAEQQAAGEYKAKREGFTVMAELVSAAHLQMLAEDENLQAKRKDADVTTASDKLKRDSTTAERTLAAQEKFDLERLKAEQDADKRLFDDGKITNDEFIADEAWTQSEIHRIQLKGLQDKRDLAAKNPKRKGELPAMDIAIQAENFRYANEIERVVAEGAARQAKADNEAIERQRQINNAKAEYDRLQEQATLSQKIFNIDLAVAEGHMTKLQGDAAKLAIFDEADKDAQRESNAQLEKKKAVLDEIAKKTNNGLSGSESDKAAYQKALLDYQKFLNDKTRMDQQRAQHKHQLELDEAARLREIQKRATEAMISLANQGFESWLTGQQSAERALVQSATRIADAAIMNLVRTMEMRLVSHLQHTALDDKDKLKDANATARKAFRAVMDALPFPADVIVAPITAAAAWTAVMAFEQGGLVPGSGNGDIVPAMLTPGERVLTRDENRALTNGSRSFSSKPNININVAPGADAKSIAKAAEKAMKKVSRAEMRRMRFVN